MNSNNMFNNKNEFKMNVLESKYLSIKGLCNYLGVSIGKVENLMYGGEIKYVKFGRNVRFDINDVDCFMNENKIQIWKVLI